MALSLKELAVQYVNLRDRLRIKKIEEDDLRQELDQIEQQMIPAMEELEAQNLRLEGVGTVYLKTLHYASVVKGQEEPFLEWLDSHGMAELAPRRVNAMTLKSQYQTWLEEDKPLPPEHLVVAFPKTSVHINKTAVKTQ